MEISDKSQLEFIDEAQSAAQMSARLTRRLLSFAKQGLLEPATISLNQYVMEALALLRSTIGENISLSSNLAPDLWNTLADPSEIENTVVNLAINARDAMPEGGEITITTKNSQIDDELLIEIGIHPGQYVQLSVADNGVGMSEEVQEHIFEPFYTTKEPGKGTGLGLASIYGFARQSGGTVTVYSEIGHGTVINVYLPRHVKEHDEKSASKPVELAASEKKLRVLVVEDNEMVRKVTVKRMQALGYSTVQVDDGTEAIKTLERDSDFDLVFSDIVMPGGVSGYDVAHWVSAHIPQCAVLLTSGFNEQFVASNGSKTDEIAVLQKPYNLVELQQAIMALDKV